MPARPLFLARAVYRRRRLRDAARLLPIIGLLLVLLPALGSETGSNAANAVYLFVVWVVLIAAAAVLAPGLSRAEGEPDPSDPSDAVEDES